MTPERWRKIKEIAFEAMELDPESAPRFLNPRPAATSNYANASRS